jgi:hypothetical protein
MKFDKYTPYHIITECTEGEIKGIKILRNKDIKTLLLADDQVVVADSKDALQISIHKLETITSKYVLQISTNKTKTMAFKG